MFEDATFETTGRIQTRSRGWMIAAFIFEASILLALVLIPLICPEALPRQVTAFLMAAPTPPPAQQPRPQPAAQTVRLAPQMQDGHFFAPPKIPNGIAIPTSPDPAPFVASGGWESGTGVVGGTGDPFRGQPTPQPRVVHPPAATAPLRVSGSVVEGLLLRETMPVYPPIGVAMRAAGTVVLTATISKTGTIENLRAASGPAILQQAALDAVRTWRYRPYLLNGQPVEVETTVNVTFTLNR
jgi:protein TonB